MPHEQPNGAPGAHHVATWQPPDDPSRYADLDLDGPLSIRDGSGHGVECEPAVVAVLRHVLDRFAEHQPVLTVPAGSTCSSQQAADILGISRPTLVRLLDAGHIPYRRPGSHRRLLTSDVVAYRLRRAQSSPTGSGTS